MQRLFSYLLISYVVFYAGAAGAGIFIEPYAGYLTGNESQQNSSYSDKGIVYGGRLGLISSSGLMIGADYMGGSTTWATQPTSNVTPSDLGAFVGYDSMARFRIYAEYIFSSSGAISYTGFNDTDKGSGYKVGIGFRIFSMLSLNLEYVGHTYTKDNSGSLPNDVTDSIYGATLSVPFIFGERTK